MAGVEVLNLLIQWQHWQSSDFIYKHASIARGMANLIQGLGAILEQFGWSWCRNRDCIECCWWVQLVLLVHCWLHLARWYSEAQARGFALVAGGLFVLPRIPTQKARAMITSHPIIAVLSAIAAGGDGGWKRLECSSAAGGERWESKKPQWRDVDAQIASQVLASSSKAWIRRQNHKNLLRGQN